MRCWSVVLCLAACAPAEPDEIEIRVSTGELDRTELSRIIVLVDPPVPFDREPGQDTLAPGIDFEFFGTGASNRLMVTFTPPPTATSIDQELLFTVAHGAATNERGSVRAIGYDLLGSAVASAQQLDVSFGGFEELELTLACGDDECGAVPKLGGYPVTLPSPKIDASPTMLEDSISIVTTGDVVVYADPAFDSNRGRIAVMDPARAAAFTNFDQPPNMLPCVIEGEAQGDRFGASVALGDHLPGVSGRFVVVGAPGATSGGIDDAGAAYVLPISGSVPACPRANAASQPNVIRIDAPSVSSFGTQVAVADPFPAAGTKLAIGGFGTTTQVFVVGSLAGSTATLSSANSKVLSFFIPPNFPPKLLLAGGAHAGKVTLAMVANQGLNVASAEVDDLDTFEEVFVQATGSSSTFGTAVQGPGPIESLLVLPGPDRARVVWGVPLESSTNAGMVLISDFPHPGITGFSVDCRPMIGKVVCIRGSDADRFGASLAAADLQEGSDDLLIGAPDTRRSDSGERVGAVYAYAASALGAPDEFSITPVFGRDPDDPSRRLLYRLYGAFEGARFGLGLSVLDDTIVVRGENTGDGSALYVTEDLVQTWGPH